MPQTTIKTIDITPTWGEWARIYSRLAESGEGRACRELRADLARMAASCEALKAIRAELPEELKARVAVIMAAELGKLGY